jgi:hypothetical protein
MSLAQFFDFDETHFVNGQARLLYSKLSNGALTDVAVPAGPADIFAQVSPYDPVTDTVHSPWVDVGGTSAPPVYDRGFTANEWKVQQQLTEVLTIPNAVTHTVKVPAAEFARADLLSMFQNGPAAGTVASATGTSAFATQPFGQFTSLNQYRLALAAFMPQEAGNVVEGTDGPVRPRLVVQVFNRVSIAAENVSVTFGLGDMVTADITLKCYVEPGQPQNEEYGCYYIEDAGTITTS